MGDMPPEGYIKVIPTEGGGRTNNIDGFDWVADQEGFRNWMQRLRDPRPEHRLRPHLCLGFGKAGGLRELAQEHGLHIARGWIPVTAAMKSVTQIAHVGTLEQRATLKGLSDAKRRSGQTWTFQLLLVTDSRAAKWFFRNNEPYSRLKERVLATERLECREEGVLRCIQLPPRRLPDRRIPLMGLQTWSQGAQRSEGSQHS